MSVWYGSNPPFLTSSIILPFQTDERLIKNDLLQLLLTSPGERVMRPEFGTNIKSFLFEPLTESDVEDLRGNIISAVEQFETRVRIVDLIITRQEENNLVAITLLVKTIIDPNKVLEVQLDFNPSETRI